MSTELNVETQKHSKSPQKLSDIDSQNKVRELNKKRGTIKGRLTIFVKYLSSFDGKECTEQNLLEIKLRQESAISLMSDFNQVQESLENLATDSELLQQLEARESFENIYFEAMAKADLLLGKIVNETGNITRCSSSPNSNSLIKLPTITLSTFDGSYDNWMEFRDTFLSMIHNSKSLDNIQKFHYLRSSLTGNALQVIKALEFSADNYLIAWDLLQSRYNNTKLLVHNHVKALFSMQTISKESSSQIRKLIDSVLKNLRALKSLGEPTETWDTLIIHIILSKLDSNTEKEWEQFKMSSAKSSSESKFTLQDLTTFLRDKANMLEMVKASHSANSVPKVSQEHQHKKPLQKFHSFVATKEDKFNKRIRTCKMCNGDHSLFTCSQFLELDGADKIKFVDQNNLCKNCLRAGHEVNNCRFGPCRHCNKKHNSLLHSECIVNSALISTSDHSLPNETTTTLHASIQSDSQKDEIDGYVKLHALESVLLSTALVEVLGSDNKYHSAKVLLDSGSQHCIISKSLCEKINALPIQSSYQIAGIGQSLTQSTHMCEIKFRSLNGDYSNTISCIILPKITSYLPSINTNYISALCIPKHIQLADPSFCTPSEIELLIGANYFWDLLLTGNIKLPSGPHLQNTKLGWIISGPIYTSSLRIKEIQCNFVQSHSSLNDQLKKFWELEDLSNLNSKPCYTPEERTCEDLFISTHKRLEDGRFSVRIPLKESPDSLGDSYETAKNRFLSLERRLERTPQYKEMYSGFMKEYIDLGHMSKLETYSAPYYFFPHHGVFRESSVTTKLRVVFNGSQKSSSGKSFNDIQMAGPPLQNDLLSILLRFRQYKFVACADIEKFFRQILIQDDQRNLQLILWREKPSDPISVYRLNTVTYGTTSAPYLSIRCVKQLGYECKDDIISEVILNDFFVDDFVTGHDSKIKLAEICKKVSEICMSGGFPLRKWIFSSPDIASDVIKNDENKDTKYLSLSENTSSKTLGLGWYIQSDELYFTSSINKDTSNMTKRQILSITAQVFDPMGILSPLIIIGKILLQKLWFCKVGWDDPLPSDIALSWQRFISSLSDLHNIRVPRHVIGHDPYFIELHIFSDASEVAYGACAYVRTINRDQSISVNLIGSKTRVAPIKPVSIPRLELCGALIGARLLHKIITSLRMEFSKILFWIDSTIVLGWLRISPHQLKTFVQNRVVEINEIAGNATFLHVNGKDNPADILSRGLYLSELTECDMWWHGPSFLRNRNISMCTDFLVDQDELPELKPKKSSENISLVTSVTQSQNSVLVDFLKIHKFSSFKKFHRVYSYVLRFIQNIRANINNTDCCTGPLTVSELNNSLLLLTRIIQQQSFPIEYNCLLNKLPCKSSRNLSSLNIFMDENKIIRVGGRLVNSPDFTYNKKHPILLCGKHYFTRLLFQQEHVNLLHGGPQSLLAHIRENWWPLGGRNLAKGIIRQCVKCARMSGKTFQPIMGNLPSERLKSGLPFLRCGVDYSGALYVLNKKGRGSRLEKCYLCLFICFVTRAVHLELVTSLTSENYIMALKRFISRRGKPLQIFSDNGRNFVGAAKEMSEFLQNNGESLINFASDNSIEFKFIPPYAPHFGGLWEAGIKSCKYHISRVVGNCNLTYEELSTVLVQIEAVLNSRPMYSMSSDPSDLSPLTPAHFLLGRPLTAPACDDVTTAATHTLARYKRVEQMRQHFWKRWSKEYVSELQKRVKWKTNQDEIKPGALVLVKEDNTPPLKWCLGRIMTVFPGQDHVSRVADVKTTTGVIRRAFSKLCPLPVSTVDSETAREENEPPAPVSTSGSVHRC